MSTVLKTKRTKSGNVQVILENPTKGAFSIIILKERVEETGLVIQLLDIANDSSTEVQEMISDAVCMLAAKDELSRSSGM